MAAPPMGGGGGFGGPPMGGGFSGGGGPPPECVTQFTSLRAEVEKRGMAAKTASEKRASREEMCKLVTAYGDADTKRKALEGGADALFTKPIDFAVLRGEIDIRVKQAA